MREAASRRDPATYKYGPMDPALNSQWKKAYWQRIPKERRSAMLVSFIEAGQHHNKRSSNTKIENRIAGLVAELGVPFRRTVRVGRYFVDLLVGDTLIIECYGDYWHCNPALYKASDYHASLHMTAGEKWEKDARRQGTLMASGYAVVVLWEADIRGEFERVAAHLIDVIDKHFTEEDRHAA